MPEEDFSIYIPIWLDLLLFLELKTVKGKLYLHSNMVRFIIDLKKTAGKRSIYIYIPIWLDLLFSIYTSQSTIKTVFTFQYG